MSFNELSRPSVFMMMALLCAIVIFASAVSAHATTPTLNQKTTLSIIPWPAHVERRPGNVTIASDATIFVDSSSPKAMAVAKQFERLVNQTRGLQLKVRRLVDDADTRDAIVPTLAPHADLPDANGAYRLTIGDKGIHLIARHANGLYYATVTLWQILTSRRSQTAEVRLHNVVIKDQPRFKWRGLMIDSVRHFQTVAQIKKLIDWMALHKLNVLHWHLTDDQGWRLEIKKYPELTKVGACRQAVGRDVALTGSHNKPYCGFYTQDQARSIVAYAAKHFITVVPEIEMPGHAQAAIASYPNLGVTGKHPAVQTGWGVFSWLYAPTPKTITFLENVLDEVMDIFPSKYIHIGGDEADKTQWKASAAIRERRKKLGLKNMDELQGWMTDKIGQYLAAHNRIMIGWDEILAGGNLPHSAVVMSWRGIQGAIKSAKKGHDTILSPSPTLYFDYPQSKEALSPSQWAVSTLKDVYSFEPVPDALTPQQAQHVLGIQGNLWTEVKTTFKLDQKAYFPRLAAVSELAWSPSTAIDWSSFIKRMPAQMRRYKHLGIFASDAAWRPYFKLSDDGKRIKVTINTQVHTGTIRYTTDGTVPTSHSQIYTKALTFAKKKHAVVRAATFSKEGFILGRVRAQRVTHAALLTRKSIDMPTCRQGGYGRHYPDDYPLTDPAPLYKVKPDNTCWLWHNVRLDGVRNVLLRVGNLPWRASYTQQADRVSKYPHSEEHGEIKIHVDSCHGPVIAHVSLNGAAKNPLQTLVRTKMEPQSGVHSLCIIAAGWPSKNQYWALDSIRLLP